MRNKAGAGSGTVGETLFWGLNMILPLVFGGVLYLLFCPETRLSETAGRFFAVRGFPTFFSSGSPFLVFLRNYLFDFLWAYSLVFVLSRILGVFEKRILSVGLIVFLFASLTELLQLVRLFPGTFDLRDILTEWTAAAFGLRIQKIYFSIKKG